MLPEILYAIDRSGPLLWRDLLGGAALAVIVLGLLHLPALS